MALNSEVFTGPIRVTHEDGRLVGIEVWTSATADATYYCVNLRDMAHPRVIMQGSVGPKEN